MTMELTFDAVTTPVTVRGNERRSHASHVFGRPTARPAHDVPSCGRGGGPAQEWRGANRGLQRIEEAFAAVLFAGLLALGTLTFGYAFDGLAVAHAAGVPAVAVSR